MKRQRGNKRQFGGGRKGKKRRKINLVAISQKARKELYPNENQPSGRNISTSEESKPKAEEVYLEESSSDDEDGQTSYDQLLSSLTSGKLKGSEYSDVESESEDSVAGSMEGDISEEEAVDSDKGEESELKTISEEGDSQKFAEDAKEDAEDDEALAEVEDEDSDVDEEEEEAGNGDINEDGDKDPFYQRLYPDIPDSEFEKLSAMKKKKKQLLKWNHLGNLAVSSFDWSSCVLPEVNKEMNLENLHVRKRISNQWREVNKDFISNAESPCFSSLQQEFFSLMNSYQDILHPEISHDKMKEVRNVYCLHILNHLIKTRSTVLKHNNMLRTDPNIDTEGLRDQGLTRPKALIVVPFRHSALNIINTFIQLLHSPSAQQISHKKRFMQEYGDNNTGIINPHKPEDWQATFAGNIDDHFRIGLAISRKGLKLYSEFYQSDIIIASPLALRTIIGTKTEKDQDFDFLSSIEILLMDQTDIFLMQNWEHVMHLLEHMHLQPKESHGVDFSRVRMWTLNGWSKYFRQTLVFSSVSSPEINTILNKHSNNYAGQVTVCNPVTSGTICQVVMQLQQVFHRINSSSFMDDPEQRFQFFTSKILSKYRESIYKGTMIYVPSYFDYVRLRNYLRKNEFNFAQICEYTSQSDISRVRQYMVERSRQFLLYTERAYFFKRLKMRNIHHVLFYQLPLYPHLYSELCNMMQTAKADRENTCSIVFSRYDAQRMSGVVGTSRFAQMLSSSKDVHMIVTGDDG